MKTVLLMALCSVTALVHAQTMGPSADLKKLDWMLGTWEGTVKWTMPGMDGDSKMTMKSEYEGAFVKTWSTMDMAEMKATETSYLGWDPGKKKYVSYTFTNFAATPRVEMGTLDGDKLVFLSEPWDVGMPGGPTVSRATMTKTSATEGAFLLEFKDGDKWMKVAEGTFKKK